MYQTYHIRHIRVIDMHSTKQIDNVQTYPYTVLSKLTNICIHCTIIKLKTHGGMIQHGSDFNNEKWLIYHGSKNTPSQQQCHQKTASV